MSFSAAILAGGYSSRFGQDKARFVYQGKALLEWVKTSLSASDDLFIVANRQYNEFGLSVHNDIVPQQGPLSGLHAALHQAKHNWLALAACDLPFLTNTYWQALLAHTQTHQAVLVTKEGKLEPLAALYNKSILPIVETQLKARQRPVHELIKKIDARIIPIETLELDPKLLSNINYLDDL